VTETTDISDVQVLDVEATPAPVTVAEPCTRRNLTDPPDWRYQAAVSYVHDVKHQQSPTPPSDPVVQYIARGLTGTAMLARNTNWKSSQLMQRYILKCWPELAEVVYYGTQAKRSAVVAMLDTCLIKGWSYDEAHMAGCPVTRSVYNLYSKAFMDLSGVRTVACWIQDYLIEPERYARSTRLLRARLMAFHGSGKAGLGAAITGSLSESEKALLKEISSNERSKQMFDYMVRHLDVAPDVYVGMMEAAVKSMSDQEFQHKLKTQEMAGSGSLDEMAENLEIAIRAYSSQEVQTFDANGLDFVNQYTKILIGNDDGKKDI
jgi:hypothetical protein